MSSPSCLLLAAAIDLLVVVIVVVHRGGGGGNAAGGDGDGGGGGAVGSNWLAVDFSVGAALGKVNKWKILLTVCFFPSICLLLFRGMDQLS